MITLAELLHISDQRCPEWRNLSSRVIKLVENCQAALILLTLSWWERRNYVSPSNLLSLPSLVGRSRSSVRKLTAISLRLPWPWL